MVGVPKKSLDDYLLQLRHGKKFGFKFIDHKDSKVSVLREFVRKKKREQKLYDRGSTQKSTQPCSDIDVLND